MKAAERMELIIGLLFKPVVRFCLKRGFRYQEILSVLKSTILQVATEELEGSGHEVNTSRLSVLSGLQRKDIKELNLRREAPGRIPRSGVNLISRVMGQWLSHPDYTTKSGAARALSFEGAESEFAGLVRTVSADMNPYTVLFALEQSGAVERDGKRISLVHSVYEAKGDALESLEMLAQDADYLQRAVEENIFAKPSIPNLHISTVFDNICQENMPKIREWLLDKGTSFHEEARAYLAKYDKDANPRLYDKQGGGKVAVCAFALVESPKNGE